MSETLCTDPPLEEWRRVWRVGFAPQLSGAGLRALADALRTDDARLIQGRTTFPLALACNADYPVESACAVSFCGWQGEGVTTVGDVADHFGRVSDVADQRVGELASCRHFLNWFDDTPRDEMRRELLTEVERALAKRKGGQ